MRRPRKALVTLLGLTGCGILGLEGGELRVLEVAAHKGACFGPFPTLCLQVREPGEPEFQNLFGTPEGFTYEWGFVHVIRIEEHDVSNVPADGSSVRRVLRSVLAKEPVEAGTPFELTLVAEALTRTAPQRFRLFAGPEEILCDDEAICDELAERVAQGHDVRITLSHPSPPGPPFPVVAWVSCPIGGTMCSGP